MSTSSNANFDKTDTNYRIQNNYTNFKNGGTCGGACATRTEFYMPALITEFYMLLEHQTEKNYGLHSTDGVNNFEKIPSTKAMPQIQFMELMVHQSLKIFILMIRLMMADQIQDGVQF